MAQQQYTQRPDLNSIHIRGRLANDPTMREANGTTVVSFTLASNSSAKNADGSLITNFYRVSAWGKRGETIAKFLKKGDQILVDGELSHRLYKDTNGNDRFSLDVIMDRFFFCGGRNSDNNADAPASAPVQSTQSGFTAVETDELPF